MLRLIHDVIAHAFTLVICGVFFGKGLMSVMDNGFTAENSFMLFGFGSLALLMMVLDNLGRDR